jgi:hypothetical protein
MTSTTNCSRTDHLAKVSANGMPTSTNRKHPFAAPLFNGELRQDDHGSEPAKHFSERINRITIVVGNERGMTSEEVLHRRLRADLLAEAAIIGVDDSRSNLDVVARVCLTIRNRETTTSIFTTVICVPDRHIIVRKPITIDVKDLQTGLAKTLGVIDPFTLIGRSDKHWDNCFLHLTFSSVTNGLPENRFRYI